MALDTLLGSVKEALTVRRVFGEPYDKDGVTIIVGASVSGGGGGGSGHDKDGQEGEGGGFGVQARPAGAYVIRDGDVRWQPALDVNRAITAAAVVAVVLMLTRVRLARRRRKG